MFSASFNRAGHTDFGKGGDLSPPIGGGPKGGDKGPMGGDWRVIRDKIKGTKKIGIILWIISYFWVYQHNNMINWSSN